MILFICCFMTVSFQAEASYRAFLLEITNSRTGATREVLSTLDWIQYHDYHYLHPEEVISMKDTWMCWRRQKKRFQSVCQRPVTEASLKSEIPWGSR